MGRPPVGKVAMTAAERQRRHRAQLHSSKPAAVTKPPVTKPPITELSITKPVAAPDTAQANCIAALEAENKRLELAQAKVRIKELQREMLNAEVPGLRAAKAKGALIAIHDYIVGCLRSLGFIPSRRRSTFTKGSAQ
jgi:hypothetical protein